MERLSLSEIQEQVQSIDERNFGSYEISLTEAPLPELKIEVELVSRYDKAVLVEIILALIERIKGAEAVMLKGLEEQERLKESL